MHFWTHNNNRETGKSRNIAFMGLCICILFKLVASVLLLMLGPEQPYHKKHSPEKAGQQSAKDDGANY